MSSTPPSPGANAGRAPLVVGVVVSLLAVATWWALGGQRPPEPLSEQAALERAAELGEQMRAGLSNQRDVRPLVAPLEELVARRPDLMEGWTLLGQVRLASGDGPGASDALGEALRLRAAFRADAGAARDSTDPREAELSLLAGSAAEAVGRLEEANRHFEEAARLAPDDARGALRLAHTAMGLGADETAAALAERATRLDAGLAAAWGLRGLLADRAGDAKAARAATQRAAELTAEAGGKEARAYALALARLFRAEGEPLLAARVLRLRDPADFFTPAVMAAHAEALAAAGLPESAANYYERWLALDPANPLAAAQATHWYLEAGNAAQARATLVLLERIAPNDERVPELRQRLSPAAG